MGNKAHFRKITGENRLAIKKAWCYKTSEFVLAMDGPTDHGCYFNIFNNSHQHDFAVDFNSDVNYDPMQYGPTTQAEQSFVPPTFAVTDDVWGSYTEMGSFFIEDDSGRLIVFGTLGPPTNQAVTPLHNYGYCRTFVSIERGTDNRKQQLACPEFSAPGYSRNFYLVTDDSDTSKKVGLFRQPVQNGNNPTYPDDNMIFKENPIYMDNDNNVGGMFDNFKIFSTELNVIPNNYYPDGRCMRTTDKDGNKQLWMYIGSKCWVPIDSLDFGEIDGDEFVDTQGASGETIDRTIT